MGDQVTFSVTVAPEVTAPVNYQWQRSDNGGTTWYSAPGASTSSSYTFIVAGGDGNAQFKCYITNGCGQLYSTAVNIGVCTAVAITSNPSPQNVTAGNAASFTVAATGVPAPSFQWQYSIDNGKSGAVLQFRAVLAVQPGYGQPGGPAGPPKNDLAQNKQQK